VRIDPPLFTGEPRRSHLGVAAGFFCDSSRCRKFKPRPQRHRYGGDAVMPTHGKYWKAARTWAIPAKH
jgi:hypothetical protein